MCLKRGVGSLAFATRKVAHLGRGGVLVGFKARTGKWKSLSAGSYLESTTALSLGFPQDSRDLQPGPAGSCARKPDGTKRKIAGEGAGGAAPGRTWLAGDAGGKRTPPARKPARCPLPSPSRSPGGRRAGAPELLRGPRPSSSPRGRRAAGQPPSLSRRPRGKEGARPPAAPSVRTGAGESQGGAANGAALQTPPRLSGTRGEACRALPASLGGGEAEEETSRLLHCHSGSTSLFRRARQIAPPPAAQQAPGEVGRAGHAHAPTPEAASEGESRFSATEGCSSDAPREGPGFSGVGVVPRRQAAQPKAG